MEPPFLIDAAMLTEFQACRRRYLLSRKWRPLRWKAKLLFDSCLRQAIVELGDGGAPGDVALAATTRFMNTGANPGLEVSGVDPYQVALDACAMLETMIETMGRMPRRKLTQVPSKPVADGLEWMFLAHADEKGHLHRTITVDRWDDDRLSQELHSWFVFGDVVMARKPLHLHVIEIGKMREGRRHSPWVRGWQHEYVTGRLRFQRKGQKALQGEAWKPVHLADSNSFNAVQWVDAMAADEVIETLLHEVEVDVPGMEHIRTAVRDVCNEAHQMVQWGDVVANPLLVPMSRAACDTPFPCSFQAVCYAPTMVNDIGGLGIYKPRVAAKKAVTA